LGEIETNVPHVLGTAEPPGPAGPAGAASPALWHVPSPEHPLSLQQYLDKRHSLMKHQFDQRVEARITWINGSTCLAAQPHNRHPEVILGVLSILSASHGTGVCQLHLSIRVPGKTGPRSRPTTASGAGIRSAQVERRWIIGSSAPGILPPRAPPTLLAYLTLAVLDTQRRSISIYLFSLLRVRLV
jgi:hypothetical protein